MRIESFSALSKWDSVTLSADRVTSAICLSHIYTYSIHLVWTGTPSGTITIEGSNDVTDDASLVTNWDVTGLTVAVSGAGSKLFNADGVGYKWIRVKFTFTSSTGAVTVTNVMLKGA